MKSVGWLILLLVFLDEVLALVALGYWGWHLDQQWLWVWLLPLVGGLAWFCFASPKAPLGHPLGRPLVKLLVFGLATFGLWDAGHPTTAGAFLVLSITVNALAQIPFVAALPTQAVGDGARRG